MHARTHLKGSCVGFRKASLALIRKMVHYSSELLLKEVCDSEAGHHLPTVLVEISATVLDQEVPALVILWVGCDETLAT